MKGGFRKSGSNGFCHYRFKVRPFRDTGMRRTQPFLQQSGT
jgi:hypothetical protein